MVGLWVGPDWTGNGLPRPVQLTEVKLPSGARYIVVEAPFGWWEIDVVAETEEEDVDGSIFDDDEEVLGPMARFPASWANRASSEVDSGSTGLVSDFRESFERAESLVARAQRKNRW